MHYGYDDLQYGKDRVGVLYTKFWTSLLYFRKDFALPCVRGCGMACIMVMMTYSMVRIELVYFIENSGLHYCTSEKTLPYHGNKIQATIYGGDIHIFRDTLIIGKNYYISNAWVKEIGAQYQIVQNNLQWTINGRTIVEEVTGDSEIIVPAVYSFVSFSRLHTYIDSLSHVEINTLTQTDTSNDAEVSQVLEIVEEQSGKSLGIRIERE
ncbi:hypothetical protein FEM48_Zijuj08G0081700 [Ziziphus jujuba var. spinosa]|uniref:Uncharacterized protein n=1 Tax=Ziziphus jujuba var. spinosa TaxID=714518 RepID=A0A978UXZ1_ZIZJJ|nr:hypothetical protein FEM48_Zijuj08G0081700 [Ziziphus jujuba var. spinosa]